MSTSNTLLANHSRDASFVRVCKIQLYSRVLLQFYNYAMASTKFLLIGMLHQDTPPANFSHVIHYGELKMILELIMPENHWLQDQESCHFLLAIVGDCDTNGKDATKESVTFTTHGLSAIVDFVISRGHRRWQDLSYVATGLRYNKVNISTHHVCTRL